MLRDYKKVSKNIKRSCDMSTYSDATTYLTEELSFKKLIKLSIKELIPNSLGSITISIILLIFSLIISLFLYFSIYILENSLKNGC